MLIKEFDIVNILLTMRQIKKVIKTDKKILKMKEATNKDDAKKTIILNSSGNEINQDENQFGNLITDREQNQISSQIFTPDSRQREHQFGSQITEREQNQFGFQITEREHEIVGQLGDVIQSQVG